MVRKRRGRRKGFRQPKKVRKKISTAMKGNRNAKRMKRRKR